MTVKEKVLSEKDPPQVWSFLQIFKSLPQRMVLLIWKMISWKGVFLLAYAFGCVTDFVPAEHRVWGFLVLFLLVVFDKQGLQVLKDLRK